MCWAPLSPPHSSFLASTDFLFLLFHQELNKYRAKCSMLFHYDWISIPLVYTQVTASHLPSPSAYCTSCAVCDTENERWHLPWGSLVQ